MLPWKKIFCVFCSLSFITLATLTTAAASETKNTASQRIELTARRTANSKTYRNPNGTDTVYVSSVPIHYKNTKGKWEDIDIRPVATDDRKDVDGDGQAFGYKVVKNNFETYFPKQSNSWVRLKSGDSVLEYKLESGKKHSFQKRQHGFAVQGVFNNCDVQYELKPDVFKEDIVLRNSSAPRTFEYSIRLKNLNIAQNDDGSISFKNNSGTETFKMSPIIMYDSNEAFSKDIKVQLKKEKGLYHLIITPDTKWLSSSDRVYPVTIDPDTWAVGTSSDCSMYIPCNYVSSGNNLGNAETRNYDVQASYSVSVANKPGSHGSKLLGTYYNYRVNDTPDFKIYPVDKYDVNANTESLGSAIISESFYGSTHSNSFTIKAGKFYKIVLNTGEYEKVFMYVPTGSKSHFSCSFSITYQNETVSPKAPLITTLAPETYGTSLTLNWAAPADEINTDAPSDRTYSSAIKNYIVERSTNSSFTTNIVDTTVAGTITSLSVTGLSYGTTYYFRVYARDEEGNPTNTNLWTSTNLSGIRWSTITQTKCIQGTAISYAPPVINNIVPGNLMHTDNCYYTSSKNPTISWTNPSNWPAASTVTSAQLFTKIAGGGNHSTGLKSDGTIWAWGYNAYGQLGDGTTASRSTPVQVMANSTTPLADIIAIAGGSSHSIALKSDGTVWSWGYNDYGQLGDGTTSNHSNPVQVMIDSVTPLTGVIAIAGGSSHSIALKSDGTVWSWGYNNYGQLGGGTTTNHSSPVQVMINATTPLTDIIAIGCGSSQTVAVKSDGTVWAWGYNNYGQLGDGTTTNRSNPVEVMIHGTTPLANIIAIGCGNSQTVALKNDGTVWAWGFNNYGQLGNGPTPIYINPVQVMINATTPLTNIIAIGCGSSHTIALKSDKTVWAWGYNNYGQLGDGTTTNRSNPVQVLVDSTTPLTDIIAIAGGSSHSLALKTDSTLWTWGYDNYGQLGIGSTVNKPCATSLNPSKLIIAPYTDVAGTTSYLPLYLNYSQTSAQTNWILPEGKYLVNVGITTNNSAWLWSAGQLLTIDTTPPTITLTPETANGNTVDLYFSSNEDVRWELYWGSSPDNIAYLTGKTTYETYGGVNSVYQGHRCGFICRKALLLFQML